MICPYCKENQSKVVVTRDRPDGTIRRYRKCLACGRSFKTEEKYYSEEEVLETKVEQFKRSFNENRKAKASREKQ